jgi:hypothetical protein
MEQGETKKAFVDLRSEIFRRYKALLNAPRSRDEREIISIHAQAKSLKVVLDALDEIIKGI